MREIPLKTKDYYPCPVCFTKGRVNSGIVYEDDYGVMMRVTDKDEHHDNPLWYKCICGAILETRELPKEAEQQ